MEETISKIVEAAKDNEEVKAILTKIEQGMDAEQIKTVVKEAADKLGVEFNPAELAEDAIAKLTSGEGLGGVFNKIGEELGDGIKKIFG